LVAADLPTAETLIQTAVTNRLATGLGVYLGSKSLESLTADTLGGNVGRADGELLVGLIQLDASGKLTVGGSTITWT
jgi:hypothetical protein